jgi:hypothetical protein
MRLRRSPNVVNRRCYTKPNDFRVLARSRDADRIERYPSSHLVLLSMTEIVRRLHSGAPLISLNRDRRAFGEKMQGGMSMDWVDVI